MRVRSPSACKRTEIPFHIYLVCVCVCLGFRERICGFACLPERAYSRTQRSVGWGPRAESREQQEERRAGREEQPEAEPNVFSCQQGWYSSA